MLIRKGYSELFFFSDLLTIDEKLFSSNCPPLDALPLYLSHFQFTESGDDKVSSIRLWHGKVCVDQHFFLVFVTRSGLGLFLYMYSPLVTPSGKYSGTH